MNKRPLFVAAALLLFSCTPGEINDNKPSTVSVTGISLDKATLTLKEGESVTLVPTITPGNATNKAVNWFSGSETVATVDDNGNVTGVKAGSATITAITEDGGKKAMCLITVEANMVPSVTIGAEHITAVSVVLIGKANMGNTVSSDIKIGFMYSKSSGVLPSNSTIVEAENIKADYSYSNAITGLEPETTYYFRTFMRQGGQETYGEVMSFTTESLLVESIVLDREAYSFNFSTTNFMMLKATVLPPVAANIKLVWRSSNTSVAVVNQDGGVTAVGNGTSRITVKTVDGKKMSDCIVKVEYIAVDLGLTVKWASCNLGSSSPEEYGDYYAWGETEPKDDYSWNSYKWSNGSSVSLTKYNYDSSYGNTDNKLNLDPLDDAASVKLGSGWRMPSYAECEDLMSKCSWSWIANYNGSGISGYLVSAINGNSLFIPADGYRYETGLYDVGLGGRFWSSSLYEDRPDHAYAIRFNSSNVYKNTYYRFHGRAIRPVLE